MDTPEQALQLLGTGAGYAPMRSTFVVWVARWFNDLDMWILGWMDSFFHTRFGEDGSGGLNFVGYSNPEFDVLATQLQEETDLVKAQLLVRDMQSFLAEDLPHITLFSTTISDVFRSSRVKFPYTNILDGIQVSSGLQCRVLIQ